MLLIYVELGVVSDRHAVHPNTGCLQSRRRLKRSDARDIDLNNLTKSLSYRNFTGCNCHAQKRKVRTRIQIFSWYILVLCMSRGEPTTTLPSTKPRKHCTVTESGSHGRQTPSRLMSELARAGLDDPFVTAWAYRIRSNDLLNTFFCWLFKWRD